MQRTSPSPPSTRSSSSDSKSVLSTTQSGASSSTSCNEFPIDLTPSQQNAFLILKDLVSKDDGYWPVSAIERSYNVSRVDDLTLLRYLRARNFDPQAAFKQYSTSRVWRQTNNIDDSYDTICIPTFKTVNHQFPQWTGRRDRYGHPIFMYAVADVRSEDLLATSSADQALRNIFMPAEYSTKFVYPLCSRLRSNHQPVSSACNIIDLTGVGPRHFWKLRAHLEKASTMATAHYPETAERIFIIGAPAFFPTIWGFVMKWFNPAIVAKIHVLAATEVLEVLERYIDVQNIPKRYGGAHEWDYGMDALLDREAEILLDGKCPDGPLRYIQGEKEDLVIAVGQDNGKMRNVVWSRIPMKN